jgi:hypothetical protein
LASTRRRACGQTRNLENAKVSICLCYADYAEYVDNASFIFFLSYCQNGWDPLNGKLAAIAPRQQVRGFGVSEMEHIANLCLEGFLKSGRRWLTND